MDGLDALLAAGGDGMGVGDVEDMVMGLREVCLYSKHFTFRIC